MGIYYIQNVRAFSSKYQLTIPEAYKIAISFSDELISRAESVYPIEGVNNVKGYFYAMCSKSDESIKHDNPKIEYRTCSWYGD